MSEKYYGNYLGIVVTSAAEDPEKRNRVQVWIPSISNTLYKNWNNDNNDKVFFNLNSQDFLQRKVLDSIRNSLPWAECASPLIGGGSAFYTNTNTGSYSPDPAETVVQTNESDAAADFSIPVAEIPSDSEVVEPDLPDMETGEYPSTTTSSTQSNSSTGETLPPSETRPVFPILNQDYTLQPGAVPPNPKLLKDVLNTARQVYGPNTVIRISSGERRGSARHGNGNAVDFFVQTRNSDGTLTGVKGDALAPLIQSWLAQGYSAGINMTIRENGEKNALHFDQTSLPLKLWAYTGEVINGRNVDISYSPNKVSSAFANAVALGQAEIFPEQVDPATLIASSQQQSSPVPYVNDSIAHRADPPSTFDGAATGTFTTTNIGAKVWVFFYGGDVQKPVYFAQSLDPASNAEAFQNPQT